MLRNAFLHFTDSGMTLAGLIIFVSFFMGLLLWVFLPLQKNHYARMSQLPLDGKEKNYERN
ncbi:MAG TPA: hypothetical protein DCL41_03970 [Bdellovibrionales bacterium]|nr:hypothetical protein [Pseudobdellovibrionaceae bacterium]HAG91000.1 hypothetical protein [Bdellovibrionales bacterium]|tara:strand:- start:372 stop:554 length:183 start_codon:yes stop_codon:yes gene_type:complete